MSLLIKIDLYGYAFIHYFIKMSKYFIVVH